MRLYSYKRFDNSKVMLDEAYVGWQNILMNKDSLKYDSFILGNSCTMAFNTHEWEKYLGKSSVAARFFDNGEGIGGVCQKLEALDSIGLQLHNIMIILDRKSFADVYPQTRSYNLFSPEIAKISKIEFMLTPIQDFLYPSFFIPYVEYCITGKYSKRMKNVIHIGAPLREPYSNNFINPREKEISEKGTDYWIEHYDEFRIRRDNFKEEAPIIFSQQIELLKKIRKICDKHNSDLLFIIGPDYYQKKISSSDISIMKRVLGEDSVWDFTGINEYTANLKYYYEPEHYRPILGNILLDKIYNIKHEKLKLE